MRQRHKRISILLLLAMVIQIFTPFMNNIGYAEGGKDVSKSISSVILNKGPNYQHGDVDSLRIEFNDENLKEGFKFKKGDYINYEFPKGDNFGLEFAAGVTKYMDLNFDGETIGLVTIQKDGIKVIFNENVEKFDEGTVKGFVQLDVKMYNTSDKVGELEVSETIKISPQGPKEDGGDYSLGIAYKLPAGDEGNPYKFTDNGNEIEFINGLASEVSPEDPRVLGWMINIDYRNQFGQTLDGENTSYKIEDDFESQGLSYVDGSFELHVTKGNDSKTEIFADLNEIEEQTNIKISLDSNHLEINIPRNTLRDTGLKFYFQTKVKPGTGVDDGSKVTYKNNIKITKNGERQGDYEAIITDFDMSSGITGNISEVKPGQLLIVKKLEQEPGITVPLKGVKFGIYRKSDDDEEKLLDIGETNEDGLVLLGAESPNKKALSLGKYVLKELEAPDIAEKIENIEIVVDNEWKITAGGEELSSYEYNENELQNALVITNKAKKTKDLKIEKNWDIDEEIEAVEAKISLWKKQGDQEEKVKDITLNNANRWKHIEQGIVEEEDVKYFVKEESFKIKVDDEEYTIEVDEGKNEIEIDDNKKYIISVEEDGLEVTNKIEKEKEEVSDLKLKKVDSEEEETVLEDAEFALTKLEEIEDKTDVIEINGEKYKKSEEFEELTTNAEGIAEIKDVEDGLYILEETNAPKGYKKLEEEIIIEIENGKIELKGEIEGISLENDNEIVVKNTKKEEPEETPEEPEETPEEPEETPEEPEETPEEPEETPEKPEDPEPTPDPEPKPEPEEPTKPIIPEPVDPIEPEIPEEPEEPEEEPEIPEVPEEEEPEEPEEDVGGVIVEPEEPEEPEIPEIPEEEEPEVPEEDVGGVIVDPEEEEEEPVKPEEDVAGVVVDEEEDKVEDEAAALPKTGENSTIFLILGLVFIMTGIILKRKIFA